MTIVTAIGLALALFGAPALLFVSSAAGTNRFAVWPRLGLWVLSGIVIWIAAASTQDWRLALGLSALDGTAFLHGFAAALLVLAGWPVAHKLQRLLGGTPTEATDSFKAITSLPLGHRLFLVLTAGVTEEILYRGYAIGVGALILGNVGFAAALSLLVFVAAHFRWGKGHLVSVAWAGAVLTALFLLTHNLQACIVAHVIVDAVGLLLAPWAMSRRSRRTGVA